MICKYGLLCAESFWKWKEIAWISVYFLDYQRQMDKINKMKQIMSSYRMIVSFLVEVSFSEAKHTVNLLYLSVPDNRKNTFPVRLTIESFCLTAPGPLAPPLPGGRVSHIHPLLKYCLHLVTPGSLAPITSSPSILSWLPRTGHPLPLTHIQYSSHLTVQ